LLTPNFVVVREFEDLSQIISIGKVDDHAHLYSFSHFVQESPTNVLLAHSNEFSKLWHDRFGHLNYHYLHTSPLLMVFSLGVFLAIILKIHLIKENLGEIQKLFHLFTVAL